MNRAERAIMKWDLSHVADYLLRTKAMAPDLIEGAIREYRRYLIVRTIVRLKDVPLGAPLVDKVWHAHILHLEDYGNMCTWAFGCLQLHRPYADEEWERRRMEYRHITLRAYVGRFGEADPMYWPLTETSHRAA